MQLDAILTGITGALRRGDFVEAGRLSAMLETAPVPPDVPALRHIARLAAENAQHIDAAATGLHAARRRLAEVRNHRTLTTYDGLGRKQSHPPAQQTGRRL